MHRSAGVVRFQGVASLLDINTYTLAGSDGTKAFEMFHFEFDPCANIKIALSHTYFCSKFVGFVDNGTFILYIYAATTKNSEQRERQREWKKL